MSKAVETPAPKRAGGKKGKGAAAVRTIIEGATVTLDGGGGAGAANDKKLAGEPLNDTGNAVRFVARYGTDCLFLDNVGWHVWKNGVWQYDGGDRAVFTCAREVSGLIVAEAEALHKAGGDDDRVNKLLGWAQQSGNVGRLSGMLRVAEDDLTRYFSEMNPDPFLLNVKNGSLVFSGRGVDAVQWEFREHRRDDLCTRQMAVDYDPEAECPLFRKFLAEIQPDAKMQTFLQVWAGYSLTGSVEEEKVVLLLGRGGNGKSLLVDLLARVMGDYAASASFKSFSQGPQRGGGDATPDTARLQWARLVRAEEPERGVAMSDSMVKQITGGQPLTVRHMRKDFFEFNPEFSLWLSANRRPRIHGADRGIWRRMLEVPFDVDIPTKRMDRNLSKKLWVEGSGIFNWMLDGLRLWLENGLEPYIPDKVIEATEDYQNESDVVGQFMDARLVKQSGARIGATVMHQLYTDWCGKNRRPMTITAFGSAMRERGVEKIKSCGVYYYVGYGENIEPGANLPD